MIRYHETHTAAVPWPLLTSRNSKVVIDTAGP